MRNGDAMSPPSTLRSVDLGHVLDEINHPARVAPLVVVPGHELHERGVQHDARLGIEGAGDGARLEIGGHESLVAVAQESLHVAFSSSQVRSTTETSIVGTRKAMPVSLPATSGTTLATALAAPVEEGMMLPDAARPPRQSFFEAPSTVG